MPHSSFLFLLFLHSPFFIFYCPVNHSCCRFVFVENTRSRCSFKIQFLNCCLPVLLIVFQAFVNLNASWDRVTQAKTSACRCLFPSFSPRFLSRGTFSSCSPDFSCSLAAPRSALRADDNLMLVIGGGEEVLEAQPNLDVLYLMNRKGFIELACKTGAEIVPSFAFGNLLFLVLQLIPVREKEEGAGESWLEVASKSDMLFLCYM